MSLTLHHADDLEPLLDRLGDVLATPLADPFTADVVVVPTAGVRDAVTAHLGARLGASARGGDGITANIDLLYIGRFLSRAVGESARDDDLDPDPWHISRLTWTVLEVLATTSVALPIARERVDWSFARRVADLFDRYATQRPQLVEAWSRDLAVDAVFGLDELTAGIPSDQRWQFEVWREVSARIGRPSLPERLPDLLSRLRSGAVEPDLPSRVALVGFVSLAPAQWQVLQALGAVRDVHVFLRAPSRALWHDDATGLAGRLVGVRDRAGDVLDLTAGRRHPLLVSWGRRSLEARIFLGATPDVQVVDDNHPLAEPVSLLSAIQTDIRLDRVPSTWSGAAVGDRSVQVHACHGETRQLEVLRDALGHVFLDHPDLRPHEVIVLCPQLERFAPLVDAVFGRGDMPIPVRVGDRSLTSDDPTAAAFRSVLALVSGRVTLTEMLALLQHAAIRRRFGFSAEDVEIITAWALDLGARWGLSPDHREQWMLPADIINGTWQIVVQQLLAGVAQPAPTPRRGVGGIPPFDGVTGDRTDIAGSFAELLSRLSHLHAAVDHSRPMAEWAELLHATIDRFCAADRDEPWGLDALHAVVDDLVEAATPVGVAGAEPIAVPLSLVEVRALLDDAVRERAGRLSLRSGAVTVTSLQPLHGVPARVVCLLGLDDGTLPSGSYDGDDILGINPCVGERNPRHDARQMLLDSVLAARDAVIITCNGRDITTNAPQPFVVPLAELLDVVAATSGCDSSSLPMVVRHPRHGFDDSVLGGGPEPFVPGLDRPFTFDRAMLDAAENRTRKTVRIDPVETIQRWRLDRRLESTLAPSDLSGAVRSTADQLLRHRLDVATLPDAATFADGLEVAVDNRQLSSLGRSLLAAAAERFPGVEEFAFTTKAEDPRCTALIDDWTSVALLGGSLPPGSIGLQVLDDVAAKVVGIWRAATKHRVPLVGSERVALDHSLSIPFDDATTAHDVRVVGEVSGVHRSDDALPVLVDVGFVTSAPRRLLNAAVRLAMCHLAESHADWSCVHITRNSGDGAYGRRLTLQGDRTASAEALLRLAVQLTWWSRSDAVPFFDEASEEAGRSGPTKPGAVPSKLASEMQRSECEPLWRGLTPDDLVALPVGPDDPVMVRSADKTSRFVAVAQWVWGVYRSSITEEKIDVRATARPSSVRWVHGHRAEG